MTAAIDRYSAEVLGARAGLYGAAELKRLESAYLRRALLLACLVALTIEGAALLAAALVGEPPGLPVPDIRFPVDILPPPPLTQVQILAPAAPRTGPIPEIAVPIPVPDSQAPADRTIARQEEYNLPSEVPGPPTDARVVMPALEPPDPTPTEYVYVEELPVPIRTPAPAYPELARQAGVEGTVQLRALIGLDGRVRDVIVDRSIALLDEAAVQAVRGWVFSPALANGRPVKVWVGVPVHFVLH